MKLFIYTSMDAVPKDREAHVLVYAGASDDYDGDLVTYVQCVHYIAGYEVNYRLNGDVRTERFEHALEAATRRARVLGLSDIYAVFTLTRPIDVSHVQENCPELEIQNNVDPDAARLMAISSKVVPFTKVVECGR